MRTCFAGQPRFAVARLGLVSAAALVLSACSSDSNRLSFFGVDSDPAPAMVQAQPVHPVQVGQPMPPVRSATQPATQPALVQPSTQPLAAPTGYTPPNTQAPGYGVVTGTTAPSQAPFRTTPQPLPQPVTQQVAQAPQTARGVFPPAMVGAQPSQPVQQPAPLPQPQTFAAPQPITSQPQPLVPQAVSAPATLPAPTTLPQASTPQTVQPTHGRPAGWSTVGGTRVQVGAGETLFSISRRYGVPVAAIQQANGLQDASVVRAGQTIIIPTYSMAATPAQAPQTAAQPVQRTASVPRPTPRPTSAARASTQQTAPQTVATSGVHTVVSGDTAFNIARRYGMTVSQLASANGLSDPGAIRIGQRLNVRGGAAAQQVASTAPTLPVVSQTATAPRVTRTPAQEVAARSYTPPQPPAQAEPEVASRQTPAAEPAQATESPLQFRWPIRGRVVSGFGTQVNGARNDGINIAVPEGASIRAAEDGEVVYAGNELRGFGNLVLVQHRGGYVTAYAHNSRIMVSRGDRVSRGEIIARAGATGDVDTPQLHFEIRRGTTPVDPAPYLPQG
ncbi:MAG: LysM peptidoglycan-binding domain-containing protein [Pseudomonadota bacterium]